MYKLQIEQIKENLDDIYTKLMNNKSINKKDVVSMMNEIERLTFILLNTIEMSKC